MVSSKSHVFTIFFTVKDKKYLNLLQQRQRYRQNSRLRKIYGQEYTPWQIDVHWTKNLGLSIQDS